MLREATNTHNKSKKRTDAARKCAPAAGKWRTHVRPTRTDAVLADLIAAMRAQRKTQVNPKRTDAVLADVMVVKRS